MSRVIAGVFGGRRLQTPPGQGTRPTSDRVREALFSTLDSLTHLEDAWFADLYAGSGAVGLEAASRGAARVTLVESAPAAGRAVRANIAALGVGEACTLVTTRVEQAVAAPPPEPYDVIFADPPYDLPDDALASVLAAIGANGWLATDGLLVVERSTRSPEPTWPDVVTPGRGRRYGETTLWYGRRS
ncbi:16S rRNA (guanine(966)-N(2))-methyltransferase RsmD [Virgisporangium aurantiacum]|uniref:DNA methylase n=1 Tax=Virgisporangium aurantiacum TaxID=175570 RepID=A0A8J3Z0L4_9ACTN|nr:16S rRNA (guanine(966)-N(2))-methyltransferase RsmD [Virgisporangium aurantiacum]GIJ53061.1 DNA methylase [Virgisporangium aurantiacum]